MRPVSQSRARVASVVSLFGLALLGPYGEAATAAIRPSRPLRPRNAPVSWTVKSAVTRWRLPAPVYRTMAATIGDSAFVLGGIDAAGVTVANIYRFTPKSGAVAHAGVLAQPTHGAAAVSIGDRIVVFGGASTHVSSAIQSFDPRTETTTISGSLPSPRADLAATVAGSTSVLLGGFDGYGPLNSVLAGRPSSGFHVLATLPVAVRYPAVAVSGQNVYLFGGLLAGGEYTGTFTSDIQQVNLATRRARVVAHLPYPVAHAKATVLEGQIVVVGGSTPSGPTADIVHFVPESRAVSVVGRLPLALSDGALVTIGVRAYVLGGISASGPLDQIEVIALHDDGRKPIT
jgi:hypothetical protein